MIALATFVIGLFLAMAFLVTAHKRETNPDVVLVFDHRGIEFGDLNRGFVPWTAITGVRFRNIYRFGAVLYVSISDPNLFQEIAGPFGKVVDHFLGKHDVRVLLDELDVTPREIIAGIKRLQSSVRIDPGSYGE